jgi:hypothetical protein
VRWLPLLVYVLAAPTLAGSIMVALLTINTDNRTLIIGTLAGFVIALPVAWFITRSIRNAIGNSNSDIGTR